MVKGHTATTSDDSTGSGNVRLRRSAAGAPGAAKRQVLVESECGAVAVGRTYLCRPFRLAVPHWFEHGSVSTPTESPEAVARPRFPQNVACGFPAPTLFGSCFTACGRLSRPRSTISQSDFHPIISPFSPHRLGRSFKLALEPDGSPLFPLTPLVACWRYEPWEHPRPLALARPAIPPSPLSDRVGYSDHVRFRDYLPVRWCSGLQPPCLRFAAAVTGRHARLSRSFPLSARLSGRYRCLICFDGLEL